MILREGENLCLQGDRTHSFYIVKSGTLTATTKDEQNETQIQNFGPGSIFGEMSLIASESMEYTVCAEEDCEIEVVTQAEFHKAMDVQPIWMKSILSFLTQRHRIAKENKRKSDYITTFPSLLFVLSRIEDKQISLNVLQREIAQFSKLSALGTYKLLLLLQDFKFIRLQAESLTIENKSLIQILYETLRHRAIYKSTSPNILSLTDQAILTAFVKAACDKGELQADGRVTITTDALIAQTKRSMHGMSLTPRSLETLLQKQLLVATPDNKYAANFDKLLNLLELNRIYPQLDKKLVVS